MTSFIVIRKSFWNAAQALGMYVNRKKIMSNLFFVTSLPVTKMTPCI